MRAKEKLLKSQKESSSMLCVGLDPVMEKLPSKIEKNVSGIIEFCKIIIDATKDSVCGYKVNTAFFEQYGAMGISALENVFELIPENKFSIADAKRGDIGNTSIAYAKSVFEILNADSITVSPYMGSDSIEPFLEYEDKMVFILGLTSNKGSVDFQRLISHGKPIYHHVIEIALNWKRNADIGFVAGATHPNDIDEIRKLTHETLLIPGIGAQGGDAEAVFKANKGKPAMINSSRGIIYASSGNDFAEAAFTKVNELNDMIESFE
jgi:orotidine-5'-phosphate decarboxylase